MYRESKKSTVRFIIDNPNLFSFGLFLAFVKLFKINFYFVSTNWFLCQAPRAAFLKDC